MERPSAPKWIVMGLALCFIFAACLAVVTPMAEAEEEGSEKAANPGVLPPQSSPRGMSYPEWQAEWWKWVLAIPAEINPLYAEGEFDASVGQSGHVWFLAGTTGTGMVPPIVRSCTIPVGTSLFFPVLNNLWVNWPTDPPYDPENPEEWLSIVGAFMEMWGELAFQDFACEVDGVPVLDLGRYCQLSAIFDAPQPNLLGIPDEPGWGPCIDVGIYLMLPPLPVGAHTIHFTGYDSWWGFGLDITYELTVECSGNK